MELPSFSMTSNFSLKFTRRNATMSVEWVVVQRALGDSVSDIVCVELGNAPNIQSRAIFVCVTRVGGKWGKSSVTLPALDNVFLCGIEVVVASRLEKVVIQIRHWEE
jgi:hypothetical protein